MYAWFWQCTVRNNRKKMTTVNYQQWCLWLKKIEGNERLEKIEQLCQKYLFEVVLQNKFSFFSVWVFFQDHSQIIGQQGKEQAISLIILYTTFTRLTLRR